MNLVGQVAVVTGLSQGIGRATALRLAGNGADVAGIHLGPDDLADEVAAGIGALGRRSHLLHADAGDPASHDRIAADVIEEWGRIDIWVNNAARLMVKPLLETTNDDWHRLMAVNLHGYFYGCRAAARVMIEAGYGRIVNISSAAAILAVAELPAYTAAKGGVEGLTKSIALELAPHGVTVNTIAPGAIDTPLNAVSYTDEVRRNYEERIPVGHIAEAEEIAHAIAFLASPDAGYITGHQLVVDGGLTINGSVGHARTGHGDVEVSVPLGSRRSERSE